LEESQKKVAELSSRIIELEDKLNNVTKNHQMITVKASELAVHKKYLERDSRVLWNTLPLPNDVEVEIEDDGEIINQYLLTEEN